MPRPVSIRASYRDDAAHLLRLEAAVAKDTRQSQGWRVGTIRLARKLALRLLEAEARLHSTPVRRAELRYVKKFRLGVSGARITA
jgi:hypothetical protein